MNPVDFFKCLGDETRLKSLLLIDQEDELCVCELMAALAESQPKISRHLAQLRQCGILQDRREGQWVYYRLHPLLPEWARQIVQQAGQADAELAGALQHLAQQEVRALGAVRGDHAVRRVVYVVVGREHRPEREALVRVAEVEPQAVVEGRRPDHRQAVHEAGPAADPGRVLHRRSL